MQYHQCFGQVRLARGEAVRRVDGFLHSSTCTLGGFMLRTSPVRPHIWLSEEPQPQYALEGTLRRRYTVGNHARTSHLERAQHRPG